MTSSFPQTLADLDQAASGTALFDADTANKPDGVTGPGTVNTIYRDDIGWQMLIVNDAPREFWQRTRKPAAPHWRNWRRFVDFRTVNDAIDAAVSTADHVDAATVRRLITEQGTSEAGARDAAIATAVSTAISNITQGLDRMAVEAIVDTRLDNQLDDERAARNDAITTAVNTSTTAIIAGRKGAIDAAIITERAAIERSVNSKTAIIDARVTTSDANLATERSERMAADTAEAGRREAAMTAEVAAREHAVRALDTKVMGDIAAAERRSDTKLETAITAEAAQRSTEIHSKIGEARMTINGAIATAVATERDARMAADRASDRAMTTQIANSGFPSGTKMLFQQSSAPTGWTKDTAHNDKALRVVSGAAGNGGRNGLSGLTLTPSGSVSTSISGSVAGHTLSIAQIPSHSHGMNASVGIPRGPSDRERGNAYGLVKIRQVSSPNFIATSNIPISGSTSATGSTHSHGHASSGLSASSSFTGSRASLNLAYVDVIIATKD